MTREDTFLQSLQVRHLGFCEQNGASRLAEQNRSLRGVLGGNSALSFIGPRDPVNDAHQFQHSTYKQDQDIKILRLNPEIPDNRIAFVNQSCGIFSTLQASMGDTSRVRAARRRTTLGIDPSPRESHATDVGAGARDPTISELNKLILKASQTYRAKIVAYIEECTRTDSLPAEEHQMLFISHSALHLLEIVHLKDTIPPDAHYTHWDYIQKDFQEWIAANHPGSIDDEFESFRRSVNPRENPNYWRHIYQCLFRGHIKTAISTLRRHPDSQSQYGAQSLRAAPGADNVVAFLIKLLEDMPKTSDFANQLQFDEKRAEWLNYVKARRTSLRKLAENTRDAQEFTHLFDVIAGDEKMIMNCSEDWREALAGLVYFVNPTLKRHELAELLSKTRSTIDDIMYEDMIEIAIIERDFQKAIRYCTKLPDWWLVAHLTDLLDHFGALESDVAMPALQSLGDKRERPSQREWYLLNYANSLIAHSTLWRVGLEYTAVCRRYRHILEAIVVRISQESELKARKLISFTRRHGLQVAEREIHRSLGRARYQTRRVGEALEHYIAARDAPKVARLVDELLDAYIGKADMAWLDIAGKIGPEALEWNGRLALLACYREFHILYGAGKLPEAGRHLVQILQSSFKNQERLVPKRLLFLLLIDSLPLLDPKLDVIVGVNDTYELMRCLEEIVSSHRRDEYLSTWEVTRAQNQEGLAEGVEIRAEAQLQIIRERLAENLSRAFMNMVD